MEFSRVFRSLIDISRILVLIESGKFLKRRVDISGNLTLVGFSRIPRLVESGRFLGYRVNSYRIFKLVDPSRFFKF